MKLSFATLGCPDWDLERIATSAHEMGYDGVELRGTAGNHIAPDELPESRERIRSLFTENDVEIACIMGYSRFTYDEAQARTDAVEQAKQFLDVARDIGCPVVRVFGGRFPESGREVALARVVENLRTIAPKAEQTGVKVAIETHDDWCQGENLRRVLEGIDSPAVGICWDACNSFFVEPLEKTFDAIRDSIFHVHFKDGVRRDSGKIKSVLPGTGELDMLAVLKLLKQADYRGYLSFEWEKKWQPDLQDPEIAFPHYVKHVREIMQMAGV